MLVSLAVDFAIASSICFIVRARGEHHNGMAHGYIPE
jgi:hypothetical protein